MGKFAELRERRIFQIVFGYAATGWIALEAASQFVERGLVPNVVYSVVFVWYVGGFFAAAIVGWYHGERGDQRAQPLEVVMLAVVALAVGALSLTRVSSYMERQEALASAAASSMDLERIAVRYFEDVSRGEDHQYLADGLTEDLIDELSRVRTLDVVSRNGVMRYRGSDVAPDSVARALEAGTVVDGSVDADGERVRVDVRLIDGESGAPIRRASFERSAEELLAVRGDLVAQVSRFLREWVGEEIELRRLERRTDDTRAWALVQRAERAGKEMREAFGADETERMEEAYQRADQLLQRAGMLDPDWVEPPSRRAWLAYERSRMAHEIPAVERWIEKGLSQAQRALGREPNDPETLEARGTLRYWKWLMEMTSDPRERDALLGMARADLERAVDLDPGLASAHSTLSHLYSHSDVPQAILAARRAYEEDAYLDIADEIVWRLYSLSFDLRQLGQARRWCQEGSERFRRDQRFVICELRLMTTEAVEPEVERAWRLVERLDSVATGVEGEWQRLNGRIFAAAVIGRAGMADSARSLLLRVRRRSTHEIDPRQELLWREAYARTVIGDHDEAIDLLARYRAANPEHGFDPGGDLGWWWSDLRDHPRFSRLTSDR